MLSYGLPENILHDQGKVFENNLFSQLAKYCGITLLRTTPWHPQTNGQTKRMNQTMLAMLKTLSEHHKTQWKNHVNKLVHAYNCTKHSSTGYSPYYLTFGRVFPPLHHSQHHSIIVEVELCWNLERSNERSLPTCFSTL